MARNDIPKWTFVGGLIGLLTSYLVSPQFKYAWIGAVLGAIIGYFLARNVE